MISSYLNPFIDLLYIWCDNRYCSKIVLGTIPTPAYHLEAKVTDLDIYVKVLRQSFKISSFLKPCMDLLYTWRDYRYWSKILLSTIPTPAYNLEGKVTDLDIYVKDLPQSF